MKLFLTTTFIIYASLGHAQERSPSDIISGQLDAFGSQDFETAFEFASPRVQQRLQNPSRFKMMVENLFPMMIGVSDVQYLEEVQGQGIVLQRIRIVDSQGRYFWFAYELVRSDNEWRINGVTRLQSPDEMA